MGFLLEKTMTQYFHGTKNKSVQQEFTVALEVPTKEMLRYDLWKLLGDNIKSIPLQIGLTMVNPKDNYCYEIGREISKSRTKTSEFSLVDIVTSGDRKMISLHNGYLMITLETKTDRTKVHLVDVTL